MKVVDSIAGRIVVEHEDGYVFTFQVHDIDALVMELVSISWPVVGPPPDAEDLELGARRLAEAEAKAQGWL
jgi:hypothetical protein